jgi:hypothetical protein
MIHMTKIQWFICGNAHLIDRLLGLTVLRMHHHSYGITADLRHRLTVQHVQECLVGGLLLVVVVPKQCIALSRERSRNP